MTDEEAIYIIKTHLKHFTDIYSADLFKAFIHAIEVLEEHNKNIQTETEES